MKKHFSSITALLLVLCIMLAACGSKDSNGYEENIDWEDDYIPDDYNDYIPDDDYNDDILDDEYQQIPDDVANLSLTFTGDELANFRQVLADISVSYEKISDADIQKCLDAYAALKHPPTNPSGNIIQNNKVDYHTLLQAVKSNNAANRDTYYSQMSDALLEKTVQIITDTINYGLDTNPYIDSSVLDHKLTHLKVLLFDDYGYAFYSYADGVLAINEMSPTSHNETEYNLLVSHEANHMMQDALLQRDDALEMSYGVCYQFQEIELNYLYWIWYVEGAVQANSLAQYNLLRKDTYLYLSYVSGIQLLNSAMAFHTENPYSLYKITAQSDLEPFFRLFGCHTQKDRLEIIKMMVAINLTSDTNELVLSYPFYEKTNADNDPDFCERMTESYMQTISKVFYRNLANRLENSTATLGDIFGLISMFENQLDDKAFYSSPERKDQRQNFYKTYRQMQEAFFAELAGKLGISEEELHAYFTAFHHTVDYTTYKNALLSQAQASFYESVNEDCHNEKTITVREAAQQFS